MLLNYINIINGRKCSFCQSISVRLFVFCLRCSRIRLILDLGNYTYVFGIDSGSVVNDSEYLCRLCRLQ